MCDFNYFAGSGGLRMKRAAGTIKRYCDRGWCGKQTEQHVFWYKLKKDQLMTLECVCQSCGHSVRWQVEDRVNGWRSQPEGEALT